MFKDHYDGWRKSRINTTIRLLREDFFNGKRLLEVGCGFGDISKMLVSKIGGVVNVTLAEGNAKHVAEMIKRQASHALPNEFKVMQHDCDTHWQCKDTFDVIVHWGLLYHLKDPKDHLNDLLKYTNYILLETEVCDRNESVCINTNESGYDQAINGVGSRPSAMYIENVFSDNGFFYKRFDIDELNHSYHCYNWPSTNDGSYRNGKRRFWIAWRHNHESPLRDT